MVSSPCIGVVKVATIQIPYVCSKYIEQLETTCSVDIIYTNQKRYGWN